MLSHCFHVICSLFCLFIFFTLTFIVFLGDKTKINARLKFGKDLKISSVSLLKGQLVFWRPCKLRKSEVSWHDGHDLEQLVNERGYNISMSTRLWWIFSSLVRCISLLISNIRDYIKHSVKSYNPKFFHLFFLFLALFSNKLVDKMATITYHPAVELMYRKWVDLNYKMPKMRIVLCLNKNLTSLRFIKKITFAHDQSCITLRTNRG